MNKRQQGWLIIAGSVMFLLLIIVAKAWITPEPDCELGQPRKTVILLDRSEDMEPKTVSAIVARAMSVIEEQVQVGELVSVFTVSDDTKSVMMPIFSACKPRKTGNMAVENVKAVQRKFSEKFEKPLRDTLRGKFKASKESPIAQELIDLSLNDLYFRAREKTRLVIFSDMLENTPGHSFYEGVPSGRKRDCPEFIERFKRKHPGTVARPSFKNLNVQLNIIPRTSLPATTFQCRDEFWLWFFGDNTCKDSVCMQKPDYLP